MGTVMSDLKILEMISSIGFVNSKWYKEQYPDVDLMGIEPVEHYIKYGFFMKRKPYSYFNLDLYHTHSNLEDLCRHFSSEKNSTTNSNSNSNSNSAIIDLKTTTSCRGYFDSLTATELRGWAVDESRPDKPVDIDIYVDDVFLMKIKTASSRGDLIRKGIPGRCAGFNLSFPDGVFNNGSIIDLRFSGTNISLNKSKKTYDGKLKTRNFDSRFIDFIYAKKTRSVTVVIPVYNAHDAVKDCLDSLVRTLPSHVNVLMIDDCSPDKRINLLLNKYHHKNGFGHVKNNVNLGYTKTVNKAISLFPEHDIVLLNSDTVTTSGWINSMRYIAYSKDRVATVTALSDNSGAFSVPEIGEFNEIKAGLSHEQHARLITQNTPGEYMAVPTGNGFCFYIRRDFLNQFGLFDEDKYPIGYGEENDLCMRAFRGGWKNLICDKAFVYHKRSQSFKDDKTKLMQDGANQLRADYPEYKKLITRFHDVEFNLMRSTVRSALSSNESVLPRALFVISTTTGGTPQTNLDLMRAVSDKYSCYLLRCDRLSIYLSVLINGELETLKEVQLKEQINVIEHRSEEYDAIVSDILYKYKIELLHIRHIAWHSLNLPLIAKSLGIPVVYSMHDFYSICPTVTLSNESGKYCSGICNKNGKDCKIALWDDNAIVNLKNNYIYRWREQFTEFLSYCDAIITTDESAKTQIISVYPQLADKFSIIPHGRNFPLIYPGEKLNSVPEKIKVIVPGNISIAKGALLLKEIIEEDRQNKIEFHFLGKVASELNGLGIHHGAYTRDDVIDKIKEIKPHIGVVLSLWPETFCHTLTEMWAAGVPVLAVDLGAVGNRIKESGAGWLIGHDIGADECKLSIIESISNINTYNDKINKLNHWQKNTGINNTTHWMCEQYLSLYNELNNP